ncbi:hypothetical protein [Streptomyces malaysiensis]|nr:hypothetical protein R8789_09275 [Streptomyces malaysiensis]
MPHRYSVRAYPLRQGVGHDEVEVDCAVYVRDGGEAVRIVTGG